MKALIIVCWTTGGAIVGLGYEWVTAAVLGFPPDWGYGSVAGIACAGIVRSQMLWGQLERLRQAIVHGVRHYNLTPPANLTIPKPVRPPVPEINEDAT